MNEEAKILLERIYSEWKQNQDDDVIPDEVWQIVFQYLESDNQIFDEFEKDYENWYYTFKGNEVLGVEDLSRDAYVDFVNEMLVEGDIKRIRANEVRHFVNQIDDIKRDSKLVRIICKKFNNFL